MLYSGFASVIESLMTDQVDIYRYETDINEDGTDSIHLSEVPIYTDVPCRISFSSLEKPGNYKVDENPINSSPKIFCPRGADVKAGDYFEVRRLNGQGSVIAIYRGIAAMPAVYVTHIEVLIEIRESA